MDFENDNQDYQEDNNQNDSQNTDFSIPEEYAEKGWTKFFEGKTGDDLKSEFFRSYDNSQTLIGKKVEDYLKTTDLKSLENYDEIKEHLTKQIGTESVAPESREEYELSSLLKNENGEQIMTILPEALDFFGDKFKELGLSKDKAQDLFKSYMNYGIEEFNKLTDADELETSLKTMFKETTTEKSAQRKQVEGLLKEFLPAEDQQLIQDSVPNKVIEMFYKVANGFVAKYGYKEGSANSSNPTKMRMSKADIDAEYNRLAQRLEDLNSRPQRVGERDEIVKQMRELFK